MARLHPAQGPGREHADDDDADAALPRAAEQSAEVLRRKARRHWESRARVEQVVADLRLVERARFDRPVQRGRLAERGDAAETDLPLLAELLHRGHDLAEDVGQAQGPFSARRLDPIVELKEIDALHAEPAQARVERAGDRTRYVGQVGRIEAKLRADVDARAQRLEHLTEISLGLSVAVRRGRVEVVDPELHLPGDAPLALRGRSADDEPADVAASEPERGNSETRLAQPAKVHRDPLIVGSRARSI